jgi:hypothetical protein
MILPLDWHVLMSEPSVEQLGRGVLAPRMVALSVDLQVCITAHDDPKGGVRPYLTLGIFMDGV